MFKKNYDIFKPKVLDVMKKEGFGEGYTGELNWRPLRDSNPCCRRERAVS
jgi:hypothetical protein